MEARQRFHDHMHTIHSHYDMISADINELIRQLTPLPLRHAALLRSLLRAVCSPLATMMTAQGNHEADTGLSIDIDGPRVCQIQAAVERYTGQTGVSVLDDPWTPPQALWLDGDTATGHDPFPIYTDGRHNAYGQISATNDNIGGTGGTAVASPSQGNGPEPMPNILYDEAHGRMPCSFRVILPQAPADSEKSKAAAHIDKFKTMPATYRIITVS